MRTAAVQSLRAEGRPAAAGARLISSPPMAFLQASSCGARAAGASPNRPRIICAAMRRATLLFACPLAVLATAVSGCGHGTQLAPQGNTNPLRVGARLFHERCGGCHTIAAADARGSKPTGQVAAGERTNGPNFDVRKENREDVLFAIRNGGFSGAIMPANIVMGQDAQDVALFLERYAGADVQNQSGGNTAPTGGGGAGVPGA